MSGTIVSVVRIDGQALGTVRVNEGPPRGVVEYQASVPAIDGQGQPLPAATIRAALIAAWAAQRAAQPAVPVDLSGQVSGTVNL